MTGREKLRVVALVSAEDWMPLRACVPHACTLELSPSASQMVRQIGSGAFEVAVLDPTIIRPDAREEIVDAIERAGRGLVLRVPLTPDAARLVAEIGARIPVEVVFQGVDGEWGVLSDHLRRVASPSIPALVIPHLTEHVHRLPPTLEMAVVGLFGWLPIPHRVTELARASAIERRSVERALARAGFRGALPLLAGARLARTWSDLRNPHLRVAHAAERNGFHSVRTLSEQYRRHLHMSPRALRAHCSPHWFARRIARSILA